MHALVFGLLQQRMDPAGIATHPPKRVQMTHHCRHHAGNAGDGFEKDDARQPLVLGETTKLVAAQDVKGEAQHLHAIVGVVLDKAARWRVCHCDCVELLGGIDGMRHDHFAERRIFRDLIGVAFAEMWQFFAVSLLLRMHCRRGKETAGGRRRGESRRRRLAVACDESVSDWVEAQQHFVCCISWWTICV